MSDVSVELGLNAQELYSELQAVTAKFVTFASQTTQAGEKAGSGFAGGFKGGLGGIGTNLSQAIGALGIGHEIKDIVEYGAKIQDLSDRFGIGAVELQKLGNAAEKNGSSLEGVARGYRFLEVAQAKALGGNTGMEKAFADLGISMADLASKRPDELMLRLGDASLNAADVVKVLGKSALELRPVLSGLADGTIQFGNAMSALDIQRLKDADDVFKTMRQNVTIFGGEVLGGFIGLWQHGIEALVLMLEALGNSLSTMVGAANKLVHGDFAGAKNEVSSGNALTLDLVKQAHDSMTGKSDLIGAEKGQKRDLGANPEDSETGQFDEQGRPIVGGKAGKTESSIEKLKDETDKEQERQRVDALDGQDKINDLKAKAKAIEEEIAAVAPRAGQEMGPEEEEQKLSLKKDFLEVTKQIAAEQKKLDSETEKTDRAQAQNDAALASAKEITKEMQLRASGDEEGARQAAIRAKYEKEIAAALDRKNPNAPLADELRKQEHEAQVEERGRELNRTPAQIASEQATARQRQQNRAAAEASLADEADRRRRGSRPDKTAAEEEADRRRHGVYVGPGGGEHSGLVTTGVEGADGLGTGRQSDADWHKQFQPGGGGLSGRQSDDDWHKQFQPRGLSRADEVKQSAVGKDAAADKHLPVAEKQLSALEKIEKNTEGMGKNK